LGRLMNVLSPISRTVPVSNTPIFDFGQTFRYGQPRTQRDSGNRC